MRDNHKLMRLTVVGLSVMAVLLPPPAAAEAAEKVRPSALAPRKVEVVNPTAAPVPAIVVNDGAVTPWHRRVQIDLPDGTRNSLAAFSVPAGQRLIAENVSTYCFVPVPQHIVHVRIDHALTGAPPALFLPVASQGDVDAQRVFSANEHVHLYFDGGVTLVARAFRDDTVGTAGCVMTVSGYLVTMP